MHCAESLFCAVSEGWAGPSIASAIAGVVGAFSGVVVFTVVLVLVTRRRDTARTAEARRSAAVFGPVEVVRVEPYTTGTDNVLPPSSPPRPVREVDPLARAGERAIAPVAPIVPMPIVMVAPPAPAAPVAGVPDDGATVVSETFFDVPPQPRRRGPAPRIRPVAPTPPRYASVASP